MYGTSKHDCWSSKYKKYKQIILQEQSNLRKPLPKYPGVSLRLDISFLHGAATIWLVCVAISRPFSLILIVKISKNILPFVYNMTSR